MRIPATNESIHPRNRKVNRFQNSKSDFKRILQKAEEYLINESDYLNLGKNVLRQSLYRNAASRGAGYEIFGVNLIECGEIRHIGKEAGGLYYLFKGAARRL